MIISISGKAGSGKDTVGKIIQHLTSEWQDDEFKDSDMLSLRSDWQIKKYSDKLKDIVCILIGCTREQLEDQEFKETPLGEEWDNVTPRYLLQNIGTEIFRQHLHPDIWVNALYSEYISEGERLGFTEYDARDIKDGFAKKPNWIITDSRFPNDVKRTREMGGVLIRVNRAECEGRENEHASETALDDFDEWDYVIENNGTIEELIEQVRTILEEEGIIEEKE